MTKVIAGVRSPGSFDKMQTERRVAANPQTKPVDLGCESAENWQLPSTSTIAIVIITQPVSRYSFHRMQNYDVVRRAGSTERIATPSEKERPSHGCT